MRGQQHLQTLQARGDAADRRVVLSERIGDSLSPLLVGEFIADSSEGAVDLLDIFRLHC